MQNIDGYLVVPYIARRTVDLAPALVLAMQLLMGALFGILGVLFADPILATLKVVLVDLSKQQAAKEAEAGRRSSLGLDLTAAAAASASAASSRAPPRTIFRTRTSKVRLLAGKARRRRAVAEGEALRHGEAILRRLPASWPWLRRNPGRRRP